MHLLFLFYLFIFIYFILFYLFIYLFIFIFFFFWGGGRGGGGGRGDSAPIHLLFGDVYWSLGRRGYFGVSNVALVCIVVISVYIINESTGILSHSCGSIDDWYEWISMHDIKNFFIGRMLVMFEEIKIKVTHNVARILCHLLQDIMHCVVESHSVTIWRAVCNTNNIYLTIKMKFCKYTFNMIINYIKFQVHAIVSAIYRDTPPPLPIALVKYNGVFNRQDPS